MPTKKLKRKSRGSAKVKARTNKKTPVKKAIKIKKINEIKAQTPGGLYIPPSEPISHRHTCTDCLKVFSHPPDIPTDCDNPTADDRQCPECTQLRKMQHA